MDLDLEWCRLVRRGLAVKTLLEIVMIRGGGGPSPEAHPSPHEDDQSRQPCGSLSPDGGLDFELSEAYQVTSQRNSDILWAQRMRIRNG